MGNSVCSCNHKQESKDVNLFSGSNENKEPNKFKNARSKNPHETLNGNMYSFLYFIKLQRAIRKMLQLRQKARDNNEKYNREDSFSGKEMFKRSGFDDKNYQYNGEYENGNKQGFGIQTWVDGAVYKGYFYENKANFLGLFEHSDGDVYKGEFKEDRACGYGLYQHANGASYEGLWIDDTQHGLGIEIWTDKSEYRGEYNRGKKSGIGSYQWADGSSYDGEWYDNTLHGFVSFLTFIFNN